MAKEGKKFIVELKDGYCITVKVIRCDTAGGHRVFEKELAGRNIMFEYAASEMPQLNGVGREGFATLYNKVRVMMHSAGLDKSMRQKIWAERTQTATLMDNLLFSDNSKNFYDRLENNQPKFEKNMRNHKL